MRANKGSFERIGRMPMPIDLLVEYSDGTESFTSRYAWWVSKTKPTEERNVLNDWAWAYPTYELSIAKAKST
jgi:hypothetical protein